ncbi:LacI family DNA-binding transcriptional regulator [Pedococcus bigeumensis]|uniref:LacI family DNA-binding transcriptional regulator n=1 Tax=Pedococcus bigeumensis TaxID=433644 RepID=UPI002FEB5FEB
MSEGQGAMAASGDATSTTSTTSTTPTPRGAGARVTLRDVSRLAGVSTTTVSHVINNKAGARIGEDARRRVREAVAALGYRPNATAANLVRGQSSFIGLVADSIATTPFAGQIIRGAQDEAWRLGYTLLIANTEDNADAEAEALGMMLAHQVQGILFSTWYHREVALPVGLSEVDHVLVNCYAAEGVRAVVPDEVGGARAATELLLAAGHRRIAFLNTTTPSPARRGRIAGHREAMAAAGLEVDPELVIDTAPDQEGGFVAGQRLAELGVTGVCCHNDRVAMGVYDALRERGLAVPDDVSVVGFDNQEVIAAHLRPPLSTVALPHYELGVRGVRVLMGVEDYPAVGPLRVQCPPVARASVTAPTTRVHDPRSVAVQDS